MKLLHALLISIAIGITSVSGQTLTAIPSLTTIPALATGDLLPIHDVSSTATNVRKVALSALRTYMWTDGVMVNSFQIPNAAAPTVDAFAEIAGDNNLWAASRGTMLFYDGTAPVAMVATLVSDVPTNGQVPTWHTGGTITWDTPATGSGSGDALVANPLSQFAATTSAQFAGVISNETGTGLIALNDSPTFITPNLGTPSLLVGTNISGTATGFTSGVSLGLRSATTTVAVSSATAPTAGQVLTALSTTQADWQTPSGGGSGLTYAALSSVTSGSTSTLVAQYTYGGTIASQATYSIVVPTGANGNDIDVKFEVTGINSEITFSGAAVYRVNQIGALGATPLTFAVGYNIISLTKRDGKWWMVDSSAPASEVFVIPFSDEATALTTGTGKLSFRAPFAFTVTGVRASLSVTSSSGIPTFDINESGVTILSTKLTVDASEKTSTTAAAAAVISDSAIADDAEITIDVDVAGTGAIGSKVYIYYTR